MSVSDQASARWEDVRALSPAIIVSFYLTPVLRTSPLTPKCLFGLPHHRGVSPGIEGNRHARLRRHACASAMNRSRLFADSIGFFEDAAINLLIASALGWSATAALSWPTTTARTNTPPSARTRRTRAPTACWSRSLALLWAPCSHFDSSDAKQRTIERQRRVRLRSTLPVGVRWLGIWLSSRWHRIYNDLCNIQSGAPKGRHSRSRFARSISSCKTPVGFGFPKPFTEWR